LHYLANKISQLSWLRHGLLSASVRGWKDCVVPRTHNSFGNRSLSAACPRVWYALPYNHPCQFSNRSAACVSYI